MPTKPSPTGPPRLGRPPKREADRVDRCGACMSTTGTGAPSDAAPPPPPKSPVKLPDSVVSRVTRRRVRPPPSSLYVRLTNRRAGVRHRVARRGERTGAERRGLERPFVDKKGGVRHRSGGFVEAVAGKRRPLLCRRGSSSAQAASSNQTKVRSARSTPQRWATRSTSTSPHPPGSSIPFIRALGANAGPESLT
jgi:hypothetical protein